MVAHVKYPQIMLKTIEIWDMSTHCLLGKTCPFIIIVGTQTNVSTLLAHVGSCDFWHLHSTHLSHLSLVFDKSCGFYG